MSNFFKSIVNFFKGGTTRRGVLETSEDRSAKEVMNSIYKEKRWGGKNRDFYSGVGSHASDIVVPYIESISEFLQSFDDKLSVCDLGCGDFNVGRQLVAHSSIYIGIDIVEDLISRNRKKYVQDELEFQCLNIVEDRLPIADCALLRQILQHLSNADIQKVLDKLANYKYIVITEHVAGGNFPPNLDKRTGQGTRMAKGSGVVITEPPFSFNAMREEELLRLNFGRKGSQIVTTLYQNF